MRYMLLGGFGHVGSGILDGVIYNGGGVNVGHTYLTSFVAFRLDDSSVKSAPGYIQEVCVVDNKSNPNAAYLACSSDYLDQSMMRRQEAVLASDVAINALNGYLNTNWAVSAGGDIRDDNTHTALYPIRPYLRQRTHMGKGYPGNLSNFYSERPGLEGNICLQKSIESVPLKLDYINMDILDTEELTYQMRKQGTVVVINAAGKYGTPHGSVPKQELESLFNSYVRANNDVAISAFKAALDSGVKRFVQIVYDAALVAKPNAILTDAQTIVRPNAYFKSQVQLIKDLRLLAASAISSGIEIDLVFIGVPALTIGSGGDHGFFSTLSASGNPSLGDLIPYLRDNFEKSINKYYALNRDLLRAAIRNDMESFKSSYTSSANKVSVEKAMLIYRQNVEDFRRVVRNAFDEVFGEGTVYPIDIDDAVLFVIDHSLDTQIRTSGNISSDGNATRRFARIVDHLTCEHNLVPLTPKVYKFLPQTLRVRTHPIAVGVMVWDISASWVLEDVDESPKIYHNQYIKSMVGRVVEPSDMEWRNVGENRAANLMAPHLFEEVNKSGMGVYSFFLTEFARTTRTFRENSHTRRILDEVRWATTRSWGNLTSMNGGGMEIFTIKGVSLLQQPVQSWASAGDWFPMACCIDGGARAMISDYINSPNGSNPWIGDSNSSSSPVKPFNHNWVRHAYTSRLAGYFIESTPLARGGNMGVSPRNLSFNGDSDTGMQIFIRNWMTAMNIYQDSASTQQAHTLLI